MADAFAPCEKVDEKAGALSVRPQVKRRGASLGARASPSLSVRSLDDFEDNNSWAALIVDRPGNFLLETSRGRQLSHLGCFSLASQPTAEDFYEVVQAQKLLQGKKLLGELDVAQRTSIAARLDALAQNMHREWNGSARSSSSSGSRSPSVVQLDRESSAVAQLAQLFAVASIERAEDGKEDGTSDEEKQERQELLSPEPLLSHFSLAAIRSVKVYLSLSTGLAPSTRAAAADIRFDGVFSIDDGELSIYVNRKAGVHLPSVVLHTALSALGIPRTTCIKAELLFDDTQQQRQHGATSRASHAIPRRLEADIAQLSPSESLLVLQQIAMSDDDDVERRRGSVDRLTLAVRHRLQHHLISVPTAARLRSMHADDFLAGRVSTSEMISARLEWYAAQNAAAVPRMAAAAHMFDRIAQLVAQLQRRGDKAAQARLTRAFCQLFDGSGEPACDMESPAIDMAGDLFALSLLCAYKRLAYEEVLLEASDRLPLFPNQTDAAAVYAEMWVMGSNCQEYFDCTPKKLGKVLWEDYRRYLVAKNPSRDAHNGFDLFTAYPSAKTDVDEVAMKNRNVDGGNGLGNVAYFGVFAVPALVDVLMLTFLGRGIYLSATMTADESRCATLALVISLVTCGLFTNWIGCGGSYYKYSMTHAVMIRFVANKMVASLLVALAGALCGLVGFSISRGPYAGLVFFCYFFLLSTYFTCMGALCVLHWNDSPLPSGKVAVGKCLLILLISPIVTSFVHGWDIAVYLPVLALFTAVIFATTVRYFAVWTNWLAVCPTPKDDDILDWYARTHHNGDHQKAFEGLTAPGAMERARISFAAQVAEERDRKPAQRKTTDPFVSEVASAQHLTSAILRWYSGHFSAFIPLPYSSTWALQSKVALDTLRSFDKGLAPHSSFILFRHCAPELAFGMLYFVLALLDRWIELLCGGEIIGLILLTGGDTTRIGISLGLVYYLISAFFLDVRCAPLYNLSTADAAVPLRSISELEHAEQAEKRNVARIYWSELWKVCLINAFGLAICTALVWLFVSQGSGFAIYLAYIAGYNGLLWFQYNRVFAGKATALSAVTGIALGLCVGLPLRLTQPHFAFADVIALNVATWSAAIFSLVPVGVFPGAHLLSRLGQHLRRQPDPQMQEAFDVDDIHLQYVIGVQQRLDNKSTAAHLAALAKLHTGSTSKLDFHLTNESSGVLAEQVEMLLCHAAERARTLEVQSVFADAEGMLLETYQRWHDGRTHVMLVHERHFDSRVHAIGQRRHDGALDVYISASGDLLVNTSEMCQQQPERASRHARCIAEALAHATFAGVLGIEAQDAILAELLLGSQPLLECPLRIVAQFTSTTPRYSASVHAAREQALLHRQLLGVDADHAWSNVPQAARSYIVNRVCKSLEDREAFNDAAILNWLAQRFGLSTAATPSIATQTARQNLHARLILLIDAAVVRSHSLDRVQQPTLDHAGALVDEDAANTYRLDYAPAKAARGVVAGVKSRCTSFARTVVKMILISLTGEGEYQRELLHALRRSFIRPVVAFLLCHIWLAARIANTWMVDLFLFHGRPHLQRLARSAKHGCRTTLNRTRISVEHPTQPVTAFVHVQPVDTVSESKFEEGESNSTPTIGKWAVRIFDGNLDHEPSEAMLLKAVSYYDDRQRMIRNELYKWGWVQETHEYTFEGAKQLPATRTRTKWTGETDVARYDASGRVVVKTKEMRGQMYTCKLHYSPSGRGILRAEYTPEDTDAAAVQEQGKKHGFEVFYCNPPRKHRQDLGRWIPQRHITRLVTHVEDRDYMTTWDYDHGSHPVITTTCDGRPAANPREADQDDPCAIAAPPAHCDYRNEDIAFGLDFAAASGLLGNLRRICTGSSASRTTRVTTWKAREMVWKLWKTSTNVDGAAAMHIDEQCLRGEPLLRPYWHARDRGNFKFALRYLRKHAEAIEGAIGMPADVAGWTVLAIKMSDLFSMGTSCNMHLNTRTASNSFETQSQQQQQHVHVLATDTGTWPTEGGGVSCCRRDVVDNLHNTRWHIIAEVANDLGMPRFQMQKQVASVKLLAQWGLDFLTPHHGVLENYLDGHVEERIRAVSDDEIARDVVPILTRILVGTRTPKFNKQDIKELTQALLDLNAYFETRDWNRVWRSGPVKQAFHRTFLDDAIPRVRPISDALDLELPTLQTLDDTLELFMRYMFIFSLPVPKTCPTVFQATHHALGAMYGVLCKLKRKCVFQVWDHCVIWRECNSYLTAAQSSHAPAIQNSLLGIMRMAAVLNLHHADVILPCTDFFNPGWEVDLGTDEGEIEAPQKFARKIDPIVNGICNMDSFEPIDEIKTKKPTVTMLSHVQYVKDVKNAILAADIIYNKWGFTDYRLDIYGGLDRSPYYTVQCQELLASKGLRGIVECKGYGNPKKVLEDTWLFLNSSISEGLPLAIGEAALTGAPIVCTDVGATKLVLQDPDDPDKLYGEVVNPNRPLDLARSQINMLAVMGQWSSYAVLGDGDGRTAVDPFLDGLPDDPTPEQVSQIQQRMYQQSDNRRRLGLNMRSTVQRKFDGHRYLREHEQMLWVGKQLGDGRRRLDAKGEVGSPDAVVTFDNTDAQLEDLLRRPTILASVSGYSAAATTTRSSTATGFVPSCDTPPVPRLPAAVYEAGYLSPTGSLRNSPVPGRRPLTSDAPRRSFYS